MPTFDGANLIMTLDAPVNGVSIVDVQQNWYKAWKQWQLGTRGNMGYPPLFFESFGGNDLTSGIQAGAYFIFRNDSGWRLRSTEESQTIFLVGNLTPGDSNLPMMIPTIGAFTVLIVGLQPITQNVDTILDSQRRFVRNLQYLGESASRRDGHLGFGSVFYWDPENGDDTANGTEPNLATKTPEAALALCIPYAHDVIFAVGGSVVGGTVYSAPFDLSKPYVSLRGPGRNFHFHNLNGAGSAVTLSAEGTQIEGFAMRQDTGILPCLKITGANCQAQELTIHDCAADAIEVNGARATVNPAAKTSLHDIRCLHNTGGMGIHIIDSDAVIMTGLMHLEESIDGVRIEGTCTEIHMFRPILHLNTGYGINILDATVAETIIDQPMYARNILGTLQNNGTLTKEFLYTAKEVWEEQNALTVGKFIGVKDV
jgi:hypothetical protein